MTLADAMVPEVLKGSTTVIQTQRRNGNEGTAFLTGSEHNISSKYTQHVCGTELQTLLLCVDDTTYQTTIYTM